jgi:hypothetical protein
MAAVMAAESGRTPPSPWIGSAMIAAVVVETASRSAAGSSFGTKVTPGTSGPNGPR